MSIQDVMTGGGVLVVLLTLLEVAPIKINPWGALWKALGKAFGGLGRHMNASVLEELEQLRATQQEIRTKLDRHVELDSLRSANDCRSKILHFNNELLRGIQHTKEEYIETLSDIDAYEKFCQEHPDFPNNRAVMAVENIKGSYKERLAQRDFLESFKGSSRPEE